MPTHGWKEIWTRKRSTSEPDEGDEDAVLAELLTLDGYNTPTGSVAPAVWRRNVLDLAARHGLAPGDRIFEVGCGAGAFLYPLARLGLVTAGIDYSESHIAAARRYLPGSRLEVAEAIALDASERYDVVASCGVFFYFSDRDYAREVLGKMVDKSTRGVWVLDVNDADREEEALAIRRAAYPPGEYDRAYADLPQLYLARAWFQAFADERGLACTFEPQTLPGYLSARYRYHAFLKKR